ncbi:MAG: ABC transporter permease [Clostridia bacterium]|nr:ABC transporter permease [Clostridia bacterium]
MSKKQRAYVDHVEQNGLPNPQKGGHVKISSYYTDSLYRLRKNLVAMVCAGIVILLILTAIFAPLLSPYDPNAQNLKLKLALPSAQHPLGTDEYGRDILSRIIYGTRISLLVGVVVSLIDMVLGVVMGSLAGYFGGWVDTCISRTIEILAAFPDILFAALITTFLGHSLFNIFIALGVVGWAQTARLIRGQVMQLKEREYTEAATASGATSAWMITKHLIPNCISTIIITVSMNIPAAILLEASLSFLGLGVSPPTSSWGSMIYFAKLYIRTVPSVSIFPGLAIMITVLAFNILGDGLRDALDPRLKA